MSTVTVSSTRRMRWPSARPAPGETTPAANVLLAMDADLNGRVDAQDVRAVADSFVYDTALPAAQEDET